MDANQRRNFGELLRTYRTRRGTTQRQLADLSTVSVRAIRDLECGRARRPRRDTVRLIADGLGLDRRERADFEAAAGRQDTGDETQPIRAAAPAPPPAPLDALVGRDMEVAALRELLGSGNQRLVTVTGLSGVGKTRIALEVAGALHESHGFPVLWSSSDDLDSHGNGRAHRRSGLIHTWLTGLAGPSDDVGELDRLIGAGPAVLVLDNYEPRTVRLDRVVALLRRCRRLRVLITARAPFDAQGEWTFPLPPLAVPTRWPDADPASLAAVASVRLLLRYVHQVQPELALTAANAVAVAELCDWLDGIPVALEAAAAWFLVYDPWMLLDHVRSDPFGFLAEEMPTQLDSLRHAVSGLTAAEHALLGRLAEQPALWSISEVVRMAGVPPLVGARMVRRLVALGLVSSVGDPDRAGVFRTLRLVRAWHGRGRLAGTGSSRCRNCRFQLPLFALSRP